MGENNELITVQGNWVMVNHVEEAEEAVPLDQIDKDKDKNSDGESDGISVISDTHLLDNTDEEILEAKEMPGSPKWTYADDSPEEDPPSKKFYLNCSQEPVQELSEQELGSLNSDLDSDNLSMVSEIEELLPRDLEVQPMRETPNYCSYLLFSTIVLALLSMILSPYLSTMDLDEDVTIYNEPNYVKSANKYDIADPALYCKEKHKNDGIYSEINTKKCKKCFKKTEKKAKKYNKTTHADSLMKKEAFLKRKEELLLLKEQELQKVEKKLKQFDSDNNKKYKKYKYEDKSKKITDDKPAKYKYENKIKKENKKDFKKEKRNYIDKERKVFKYDKNAEYSDRKFKDKKFSKHLKHNQTSGWYEEMYKGRRNIRKVEREADWYFDRVKERNQKRNKALWYFNYMGIRETNRYKKYQPHL